MKRNIAYILFIQNKSKLIFTWFLKISVYFIHVQKMHQKMFLICPVWICIYKILSGLQEIYIHFLLWQNFTFKFNANFNENADFYSSLFISDNFFFYSSSLKMFIHKVDNNMVFILISIFLNETFAKKKINKVTNNSKHVFACTFLVGNSFKTEIHIILKNMQSVQWVNKQVF